MTSSRRLSPPPGPARSTARPGGSGPTALPAQGRRFLCAVYPAAACFAYVPWQPNVAAPQVAGLHPATHRAAQSGMLAAAERPRRRRPKRPVLRVDIQEAHACAVWLGGWLPSLEQWDKAAGRFESNAGEGPFEGTLTSLKPDDVAVGRDGQVDEQGKLSRSARWPRRGPQGRQPLRLPRYGRQRQGVDADLPHGRCAGVLRRRRPSRPAARVHLRGGDYAVPDPLLFRDIDGRVMDLAFWRQSRTQGGDVPILGFRVVVPAE